MHSVSKKIIKRKSSAVPEVVVKNKVIKVDTLVKVKKSATKAELFLYIESLEQKYDAMEKDHNQIIDKI